MIIGVLLVAEGVAIVVIGILHLVELGGFERRGIKLKQLKLDVIGRTTAFSGTILVLLLPQLFNVQHDHSAKGGLIFFSATAIGFCIFIIGLRLRIIAYKTEDETPRWIKKIAKVWK